jgi:hypothetical protein
MQGAGRGGTWRRGCSGTLAPRAERSFVRLAAEDRACPRSRTARQPSSPAGVCGSQRQIALLALKPKGAGSRSRNSTPVSRIASMCARAVEDLALHFQASRLVRTAAPAWPTRFRRWFGEAAGGRVLRHAPAGVDARRSSESPGAVGRRGSLPDQRKACRLPQWATLRPIFAPCVSANRKWTPDHTRASTMSSRTCEKLVNCRVTPPGVVPVNVARSRP